jgi:hypothetical protein
MQLNLFLVDIRAKYKMSFLLVKTCFWCKTGFFDFFVEFSHFFQRIWITYQTLYVISDNYPENKV